jgi:hypothetical protein
MLSLEPHEPALAELKSEINGRGHLAQILMKLAFSGII